MSAFVTGPPIQVDLVNGSGFPQGVSLEGGFITIDYDCGPWKAPNGALYCLLVGGTSGPTATLNIFKSTNGGLTWTQMDAVHSPSPGGANAQLNTQFNASTGLLTMAYGLLGTTAPATISWATFNTATDLFAATVYPNITDALSGPHFVVRSDATVVLWYQQSGGSSPTGYRINTAGTWGAFVTVAAAIVPAGTYLDAAGTTHLIYEGAGNHYVDLPLSAANALGSTAAIFTALAHPPNTTTMWRGAVFGTSLLIPVVVQLASGECQATVYAGTPLSAPVYTGTLVGDTPAPNGTITNVRLNVFGSVAYLSWNVVPFGGANQMWYSVNSGSGWSTPALFYDEIANPPASGGTTIADVSLLAGSLFGLVGMGAAGFFLIGSGPPVLTIRFGGVKVYS